MFCSFSSRFRLLIKRPPISKRTNTLFPFTAHVRSSLRNTSDEIRQFASISAGFALQSHARSNRRLRGRCHRHYLRRSRGPATRLAAGGLACLRTEEHTSELQSLMHIQYVVFCLY